MTWAIARYDGPDDDLMWFSYLESTLGIFASFFPWASPEHELILSLEALRSDAGVR